MKFEDKLTSQDNNVLHDNSKCKVELKLYGLTKQNQFPLACIQGHQPIARQVFCNSKDDVTLTFFGNYSESSLVINAYLLAKMLLEVFILKFLVFFI